MSFIKEFKEFAMKGNVVDLATGVIIGGAFSKIVTSLVNDIVTPLLGIFTGKIDFSERYITIRNQNIKYGSFITNIIDFLIISFSIFIIIKQMNKLRSKFKPEPASPPAASTKTCPYCQSSINIKATRCPNCTSILESDSSEQNE